MSQAERNHSWISREYNDQKWLSVLKFLIEQQKYNYNLSTFLNKFRIDLHELQLPDSTFFNLDKSSKIDYLTKPTDIISLRRKMQLPHVIAWDTYDLGSTELLKLFCPEDADAIVELGSGFGLRLADLWLKSGKQNVPYYAFEYTANGRKSAELLGSIESDFDLRSYPFDYYQPDLKPITSKYEHIYFITHSSIEQIPKVPVDLLEAMTSVCKKITVSHLEPIGWQIKQEDDSEFKHGTSKQYAEANDYNRNYWSLLRNFLNERNFSLNSVQKDILGIGRENAVTFINWST